MELLDSLPEAKKKSLSFKKADWVVSIYHHYKIYLAITTFGTFHQYYSKYLELHSSVPKHDNMLALINIAMKIDTDFSLNTSDYANEEESFLSEINWNVVVPTAEKYIYLMCSDEEQRYLCYLLVFLRFIHEEFESFTEKEIARSAYLSIKDNIPSLTKNEQKCAVLLAQKCDAGIPTQYKHLSSHLAPLKCPTIKEYSERMISPLSEKREPTSPSTVEFIISEQIGKGAYAKVFTLKPSKNRADRELVVKQYSEPLNYEGINSAIIKEIGFLQILKHPNILTMFDISTKKKKFGVALERYDTTLKHYAFKAPLSESEIKKICVLVLKAVDYLHSNNILHRDIKSENVFIKLKDAKVDNIVLADFGFMIMMNDNKLSSVVCTPNYRPPEIYYAKPQYYGKEVDMWSVGCVLAELFINTYLFYNEYTANTEEAILTNIFKFVSPPNEKLYDEFYKDTRDTKKIKTFEKALEDAGDAVPCILPNIAGEFLLSFLNIDPDKRISAREALLHPFLTQ